MLIVHAASNILFLASASKCVHVVNTKGENINICWSPNGNTIAVGNKVCKARVYMPLTFSCLRGSPLMSKIVWRYTELK